MASLGHVAIGMAAARARAKPGTTGTELFGAMIALSALSLLPDVDVLGFARGVPYGAPLGHRGASHSIIVAAAIGLLCGASARVALRASAARRAIGLGVCVALVVASHGLLDAMTDGGKGVALLWPLRTSRYFLPWRPIPVAPIGARFLSLRGLRVARAELVQFSPLFLYAVWPRRHGRPPQAPGVGSKRGRES